MILAVDQSTSATKAVLFDAEGRCLDKESLEHRQHYPKPAWVEHDAEEIYRNTVAAVGKLVGRNEKAAGGLLCLSISNQRETFVVFEKGTGRPLHNAIVWQCRRGDPVCRELKAAGHEERVRRSTGLPIDTYFPAPKLKWLIDSDDDVRKALESGRALFGTIDTYLIYRLTGGEVFATDHTNASRTLLFDIKGLEWDEGLCRLFGVPVESLAEVREPSARFGESSVEGTLAEPVPICGVMGDSHAALFAERCYGPGEAKVTFGTGSSCLMNLGPEMRFSESGLVTTIGYALREGGRVRPTYAFEGIINSTGATIAWLKDRLELVGDPGETEGLARAVDDNAGVYLVPAFVGLSAPYWNQEAKAAILGLTPHSTRSHVVRAALESIAYQVRDVLDLMAADSGVPLARVNADGGMVANSFLMQFVADMAGITVAASDEPELSAQGAALAGGLGTGLYGSLDEVERLPRGVAEYAPSMEPDAVERNYEGWKRAVARVL